MAHMNSCCVKLDSDNTYLYTIKCLLCVFIHFIISLLTIIAGVDLFIFTLESELPAAVCWTRDLNGVPHVEGRAVNLH